MNPIKKFVRLSQLLFLSISLLLGTISSCSNYDEGPALSFRSKTKRLFFSSRTLTLYSVNGTDSTAQLIALVNDSLLANENQSWEGRISTFEPERSLENNLTLIDENDPSNGTTIGFLGWANEEKSECTLIFPYLPSPFPSSYTIQRLSNKELWLQRESNGSLTEIRLETD